VRSRLKVLDEPLPMGGQSCKAADADYQSPGGPGIGQRNDPDRCRSAISPRCRCRKHSHANSATYHLAYRIEAGNADAQFQATAGADRVIFHLLLEGMTSGEADIVIIKDLAKRDRPLMAHHMTAWCNEHKPIFGKGECLQFLSGIDFIPDDTDLGMILRDGAHNLAARTLLQIDVDLGME